MKTMKKQSRMWLHLLCSIILLAGLTACSSSEGDANGEPEAPKPTEPISDDDWKTISTDGGTIEKEDITIEFPSGTFTTESKVAVTEMKQGEILGEDEASKFYQIVMPVSAHRPITFSVKCDEQADDIYLITYINTPSKHLIGTNMSFPVSYDATYSDGKYTATLPVFQNGDEEGELFFSVGLAHRVRFSNSSNTSRTRNIEGEKEGDISWYFETDRKFNLNNAQVLPTTVGIINGYMHDALKQIDKLGFKIRSNNTPKRRIPITLFKTQKGDELWGEFKQHFWDDANSWFAINERLLTDLDKAKSLDAKATIYHELLHYFQSEYDQRSPYSKYKYVDTDELLMYEAGGQWIEKFTNKGEFPNTGELHMRVVYFIKGLDFRAEAYKPLLKDAYSNATARQAHGYAMGSLLYYLSGEVGDDKIIDLYKIWGSNTSGFFGGSSNYTTMQSLKKFAEKDESYLFMGGYDSFIRFLLNGEIIPSFKAINLDSEEKTIDAEKRTAEYNGTCYAYGVDAKYISLYISKQDFEKKKKLVIKQETNEISTIVYDWNNKIISEKSADTDDQIVISSASLEKYKKSSGDIDCAFTVVNSASISETDKPKDYKLIVELKDEEEEGGYASVSPNPVRIGAAGSTELVTIDKGDYKHCGVDPVPSAYDSWLSVMFNADRNEVAITALPNNTGAEREGKIYCWVSNKEEPGATEKKPLIVEVFQEAGNGEETLLDVTDLVFPVEGGAKTIKYSFGEYQWMSRDWDDDTWLRTSWSKDYLSAIAYNPTNDNRFANELYVCAFPNETGVERTQKIRFGYTNEKGQDFDKRKIYTVNVLQEGGAFNMDMMKNLFVGTWYTPQDLIYTNGDYYHRRYTFRADNTFVFEGQTTSSTSKPASWVEEATGTYTVRDYKVGGERVSIHIEIPVPGEGIYYLALIEVFPHFIFFAYENTDGSLRHSVYMERE